MDLKRCNIEQTESGVRICFGLHEKNEPCHWEYFTRATDPLLDQLKAELNRLYTKIEEDRFAALADDSVPRLVFHAAIDAIANKDAMLEKMAEALEDALRVCEWGEPQPKPVAKRIEAILQEWEATCQVEKR